MNLNTVSQVNGVAGERPHISTVFFALHIVAAGWRSTTLTFTTLESKGIAKLVEMNRESIIGFTDGNLRCLHRKIIYRQTFFVYQLLTKVTDSNNMARTRTDGSMFFCSRIASKWHYTYSCYCKLVVSYASVVN